MIGETERPETADELKEDTNTGAELGGIGGAVAGAVAGSMAGPIGTIAGAVIGGIVGAVTSKAAVGVINRIEQDHSVSGAEGSTDARPEEEPQELVNPVPSTREDA